jgi:ribose transport system ATP-binding protein
MEELMGVCDRILVMSKGRITGELDRSEFSQDNLIKLAIGDGAHVG